MEMLSFILSISATTVCRVQVHLHLFFFASALSLIYAA